MLRWRDIMKLIINIIAFLIMTNAVHAEGIILGYQTGNDYLKMDEESRKWWIVGALDGIMAEAIYTKNNDVKKTTWLERCVEGISLEQIKAMFEKELKENPEGWHAPAAVILRKKCKVFVKEGFHNLPFNPPVREGGVRYLYWRE
jgi:hypothetical protein